MNNPSFFMSHRFEVAAGALAAGYDVHVATPGGDSVGAICEAGFSHHAIALRRGSTSPWGDIRSLRRLILLYRDLSPDIVHHVTIKPVLLGGIAARIAGVTSVVNAVSGLGYLYSAPGMRVALLRAVAHRAYRLAFAHRNSVAIFQNRDDLAEMVRRGLLPASRAVLMPGSGVDLGVFRASEDPHGRPIVLLPARMLFDKGVAEFVEAARLLRASGSPARFVLCGAPDPANPRSVPEQTLLQWGEEGAVEWWGHRRDMDSVMRAAHVICLPSYREGVPKALIEAAACARVIVATDVPGCREIVHDGVNGLLVPPKDPAALARALGHVLSRPQVRRAMGKAGRRLAESRFGVDRVVSATLAVYETLLARALS